MIKPIIEKIIAAADQQEELSADAWERVKQGLEDGTMTTKNGMEIKLKPSEYVKLIQWLAALKARRPTNLPPPRDALIKTTDGL